MITWTSLLMHATLIACKAIKIYCCWSISALQSLTVQVLYYKPSTETWDVFSPTAWIYLSVQPPIHLKRCRTLHKRHQEDFMQAALAADLHLSHGRFMSQSLKWWTAELVLQLHQYVACNCSLHSQHPPAGASQKLHLSKQVGNRVSDAACNHSPQLLGLALVQLSTRTPPPPPKPPPTLPPTFL